MVRKLLKRAGVCLLSLSMVLTGNVGISGASTSSRKGAAVETKTGSIVIDGNDIKADNVNGLTYKGFGMLSANSTNDLLMDYKSQNPEAYAKLMQYLFGGEYPIFTHVKLEMGNDRNNSTGSESATKRTKGEKANVLRNPGWQLAADAKKINPNLKVSILTWRTPSWVKTDEDKYIWYKQSILDAYEKYGYMVDYINPNTNEEWGGAGDVAYTKKFAKWIAAESTKTIADEKALALFKKIKLVVSDEANVVSSDVANKLKDDKEFMNAVDVVGYHYKTADDENNAMKWLAEEVDKEVWNSEEQATFSNSAFRPSTTDKAPTVEGTGIGGSGSALEMGNTVIKSFVESRRGHVIYQPAIGSFYEGAQYSFKELVSARDPWSGWIHYDAGLLILSHISKFAVTGWENETNTAGIWRGVPSASKASAVQGTSSNAVDGKGGFTGGMEDYKDTLGLGGAWSKGDPVTLIGDYRWTNYAVSIDAFFENQRENQYAQVGIRQTGRTQNLSNSAGYSFKVNEDGTWVLQRAKLGKTSSKGTELVTGSVDGALVTPGTWFNLKLRGEGNVIKAHIPDLIIWK